MFNIPGQLQQPEQSFLGCPDRPFRLDCCLIKSRKQGELLKSPTRRRGPTPRNFRAAAPPRRSSSPYSRVKRETNFLRSDFRVGRWRVLPHPTAAGKKARSTCKWLIGVRSSSARMISQGSGRVDPRRGNSVNRSIRALRDLPAGRWVMVFRYLPPK